MNTIRGAISVLLPVVAITAGCSPDAEPSAGEPGDVAATVLQAEIPPRFAAGEAAFDASCSVCHGTRALGTAQGPPLVHIIYEPSHHADVAFLFAVERGVRAHHWSFGDMPPLPDVSRQEIEEITAYIRHLQQLVGIR